MRTWCYQPINPGFQIVQYDMIRPTQALFTFQITFLWPYLPHSVELTVLRVANDQFTAMSKTLKVVLSAWRGLRIR